MSQKGMRGGVRFLQAAMVERALKPRVKKNPRKATVGVKSSGKFNFTDRYGTWKGTSRVIGVKGKRK